MSLRPFWAYYGGKWRAAPRYPAPLHDTIIEPFAGAAGYSLRHHERKVILVEKYTEIAEIWRYLIKASSAEILRIPLVDSVHDLPSWVPIEAYTLIGFNMNNANAHPCRVMSSGLKKLRANGRKLVGWSEERRSLTAAQVNHIRHWKVIEGDYTNAPSVKATWFIDPPYNNRAGSFYVHSTLDYPALSRWCRTRPGQTIVCENEGADWLPLKTFATLKAGVNGKGSKEVIYTN